VKRPIVRVLEMIAGVGAVAGAAVWIMRMIGADKRDDADQLALDAGADDESEDDDG
jgi:hypothetical protein